MTSTAAQRFVACGPSGVREKDDYYPTPPQGTEALLRVEKFDGVIWEPACGAGDMSRVMENSGYRVISTDLVARGYGESRVDFLMELKTLAPNIVTNPPFKMADDFARHALQLATAKVCLLCRIQFLEGVERRKLFDTTPPARVWVFSWRLPISRGEIKPAADRKGSMATYAWFVWDSDHAGKTELGWI